MPFKSLGLSDPLVQGILATGYTAPTEIQSQAIPIAIEGKDLIGCAQTGTGKTAAFVLPILNRLSHELAGKKKFIRSLILTPTRELALQIEKCILDYSRFLHLRTLTVYGGVGIEGQLSSLRRGVDIVVATPGRLLDHMHRRSIDLSHVEVLVLDEADRMFDMGFINDVRKIIAAIPKNRQTLLFSATMP
ncbi:MAG: DEAD/DEAH box helicase, partial [Sedimentisphaerales bacterium]|nr:DEAD/DEAH box helicase [Sedimentisphaerales bacterium]